MKKLSRGELAVVRSEIADLREKARQTRGGAVFATSVVALALFIGLVIGGWTWLLPIILGLLLPNVWRRDRRIRTEIARRELRIEESEGVAYDRRYA